MNNKLNVAIIGGGASGIFCAILLKEKLKNIDVCIYEGQNKIGKKILQTGNGKCNLSNTNLSYKNYNTRDVEDIIKDFDYNKLIKILNNWGLMTRIDEEGRIYPYSEKATTVVDVFLKKCYELGIIIKNDCYIENIDYQNGFNILSSNNQKYKSDYVIICTGGCSSINYKYNTNKLIQSLGHNITSLNPSLCALQTKENTKPLSGLKVKCIAKIIVDGKVLYKTKGEVLFKDNGLSGIAIFILSQYFQKNKENIISLDLYENKSEEQLNQELINENKLEDNLIGYFPKMINLDLIKKMENNNIGKIIKNYNFNIIDTYGFNNSQVTKGGVLLNEINKTNCQSLKNNKLYIAGEALDVDGSCGGYNLHFAFACGYQIAKNIIKEIGENR